MMLGDRLRQARETKGWSLVDVAAQTGWHFSTIAGWERGVRKPDPDKLATLARLYDVSADVLLGLTDDPSPTPSHDEGRVVRRDFPIPPVGYEELSPDEKEYIDRITREFEQQTIELLLKQKREQEGKD